jgi:hypothetical protein
MGEIDVIPQDRCARRHLDWFTIVLIVFS